MTLTERAAVTECVRLIELLLDAKTPAAKSLGAIILTRIAAISRHGLGEILSEADAELWCRTARANEPI